MTSWRQWPLDELASVSVSTVDKKSYADEVPVRLCNYTDVYYNDLITSKIDFMEATATKEQSERFAVEAGDVVITKDSETSDDIGRPAYVPTRLPGVVYGYHLAVYRPFDLRYSKFLKYAFDSADLRAEMARRTPGVTRVGLSQDTLRNMRIPAPSAEQAKQIAEYLDHETAEIDAFIADLRYAKDLLDRRILSEIHGMVAPLGGRTSSDSAWYGDLPTGWSAERLSWLFRTVGSGTTPRSDDAAAFGGDIPWATTSELREAGVRSTKKSLVTAAFERYSALTTYPPGSVMVAMYGATIGRLGWLEVEGAVNQAVCVLANPRPGFNSRIALYSLWAAREHLRTLADGGGQPNINQEKIRAMRIPVPPASDQPALVAEIETRLQESQLQLADIDAAVLLAKERRAALITAAVTGQIDVSSFGTRAARATQPPGSVSIQAAIDESR